MTGSALVLDGDVLRSAAPDASGNPVEYPIAESIPVLLPPELRADADGASEISTPDQAPKESSFS